MKKSLLALLTLSLAFLFTTSANAAKYAEGEVADGGAIQGQITYNGAIKTRTVLPTKDKEVCGKARKIPLVTVGDGGAVQDAVVYLKDVASGKAWPEMGSACYRQRGLHIRTTCTGHKTWEGRYRQFRPGSPQHSWLLWKSNRIQRWSAIPGCESDQDSETAGRSASRL